MKSLVRLTCLLLGLAIASTSASAIELLRTVPPRLDPAKAYVLLEIRNHVGGSQAGVITIARYDSSGGDIRGGIRSPHDE